MNKADEHLTDRAHLWHPYTRFSTMMDTPLPVIVRGQGPYLYTADGVRYTDAISSWWACALGHGHPRIVQAIQRQTGELQHSILGNLSHPRAIELAHRLALLMPTPDRHVLFSSDGASAVEAALKIAVQYAHNTGQPQRRRLAYLREAYHGDTLGAVSVGFLEHFHQPFKSLLVPAVELPVPHRPEEEPAALEQSARLFHQHPGEIAALIVEPLCQGAAGMKLYSASHLRQLATLCHEHGALLIVDEIATGFGRTGSLFAFQQAGLDPDIVCVGKALSAGYLPISAAIVKDAIYNTFSDTPNDHTFYHGHTFCGNPIACAASLAALDLYAEERIEQKARAMEAVFRARLAPLAQLPQVRELRFLGAIAAVEMTSKDTVHKAKGLLLERHILARPLGTVLYLLPPLNIPAEALNELLDDFIAVVQTAGST